ncbi:MAG TPA: DUF2269 family protein [Gaiellaceae bacterium]|nr:DUF2269 family protein [Gaiellaceae bacterium]
MYDFLLLVHVLSAFALLGATAALWAIVLATRPARPRLSAATAALLLRPTTVVVIVGTLGTLVFGVWLAIYLDEYQPWDGWIVASLVLWLVGTITGARSGNEYNAAGTAGDPTDAARLWKRGNVLSVISTVAVVAVLVLMIYKPGA